MGTLDSIFNRARDVANDMGKKANDVVEVSKLKLSVVSLGSDIDKVYQKLGLMVYEMVKSGSENRELIDGCVAEVDALKIKLDEVNAKMDELKNVRRCEGCGNAVELSAQFCPMCGTLIRKPVQAVYAQPAEDEAVKQEPQMQQEPEQPAASEADGGKEPEEPKEQA